jgi:hypothetical protein
VVTLQRETACRVLRGRKRETRAQKKFVIQRKKENPFVTKIF